MIVEFQHESLLNKCLPHVRIWAISDETPGSATDWGTRLQQFITNFHVLSFQVMSSLASAIRGEFC